MSSRTLSTAARAERDGVVVCPDVLVVVEGMPAGLGTEARDDLTAWFYGALERGMDDDLEGLAAAAQSGQIEPEVTVDLVLQVPGGVLRLDGCRLGLPVRHAGPASTLQYRVAHPGVAADAQLELPLAEAAAPEAEVVPVAETIDSVVERLAGDLRPAEPEPEPAPIPVRMPMPMPVPQPQPQPHVRILRRLRHLRLVA